MYIDGKLLIAKAQEPVYLVPKMANRHGLVAGATGTGKTVTLKTIIQSMSDAGIPTFVSDIKGDVSGIAVAGEASEKLTERLAKLGIDGFDFHACPVRFWDVFGEQGLNVRTTVTEMGPLLLSRLMGLTDVQEGVLNIVFHVADDNGMLLLDLKDLRAMVGYVGEHADEYRTTYGNVSAQSIGAIQRALLVLDDAGAKDFFGEPALDINDWLACDADGKGYVNILDCVKLVQTPLLYSTFLLWMLSELYETMPEVGDAEKPKICFFFDEAHLLFDDAPKALLEKIEQVVKLVRSKGVGVYFCTQNPIDIAPGVLAQLGNRVQHALRAYTPAEQKGVKAAAESFRENPGFDTEKAIGELGTGEALVSFLDEDGVPGVVQRAMVIAPSCSMSAAPADAKTYIIENSDLRAKYATPVDRESAYELLTQKTAPAEAATAAPAAADAPAAAVPEAAAPAEAAPAPAAEAAPAPAAAHAAPKQTAEEKAAAKAAEKEAAAAARIAEKEAAAAIRAKEREEAAALRKAEREQIAAEKAAAAAEKAAQKEAQKKQQQLEKMAGAALTSMSRTIGTSIARGLMNTLKKGL